MRVKRVEGKGLIESIGFWTSLFFDLCKKASSLVRAWFESRDPE